MAIYTTTRCRHCGYSTRLHEPDLPRVQLGQPVSKCVRCGNLIVDSIETEYEFMTEKEKQNFKPTYAFIKTLPSNIVTILLGILFLIGSLSFDGILIVLGLLASGLCLFVGISTIFKNAKALDEKIMEQYVYESLQRTKNLKYVEYLLSSFFLNFPFTDPQFIMDDSFIIFEYSNSVVEYINCPE